MKKLTAGIFTVLIGLCAANSADATVASSAWVNEKVNALSETVSGNATTAAAATKAVADDLAAYKTSNNAAVALKAAQADLEATNTLVGTLPADTEATTIVGYIDAKTANIASDETVNALAGRVTTNEGAIATLNGTGAGSVSKSIADALATHVVAADGKYATITNLNAANQAIAGLETSKEAAANKLKTGDEVQITDSNKDVLFPTIGRVNALVADLNADVSGEIGTLTAGIRDLNTDLGNLSSTVSANKTAAADATKAVADDLAAYQTSNDAAVSANTSAIATINDADNGILAQAKVYAKEQADAASGSASDVADDLSEFKTTVSNTYATQESLGTTNTNVTNLTSRVDTAEGKITTLEGAVGDSTKGLVKAAADNAAAAEANAALIKSNADLISANSTAIANEEARAKAAEQANADAAAAAQAKADAAIPAPTGECSNPTNKCVLTYNNAAYTWEVIERATGEVVQ